MNVLVDTSVWSFALRRKKNIEDDVTRELAELVAEGRVVMVGQVRQELLSGIKLKAQFESLRRHLRAFRDLPLDSLDFERAAEVSNRCWEKGVQGSHTDFLLCAIALRRDLSIFTTDGDFDHYARIVRLSLHPLRRRASV